MKKKRMVVAADFHSGHEFGLTPPNYQRSISRATGRFERKLWNWYAKVIDSLKPIDIFILPGDAIEGKGESSGGVELITPDRHEQVRMAAEAIAYAEAPVVRLFYGTRRHVGKEEDFESVLVDSLKNTDTKIKGHGFFSVNGRSIDIKHKIAGSTIPHGRMTPLAKAVLWNRVWASEERQPKGEIFIRAHVHYFAYCGGTDWVAISCPALTYNSHFGIRNCEGLVNVGLIVFDFDEHGGYSWREIEADFAELKVRAESL
jgi:hypothetical protein